MGVEVVADLAEPLPFGKQDDETLDCRREGGIRASPLAEQCDDLRVRGEKLELGLEGESETLERTA